MGNLQPPNGIKQLAGNVQCRFEGSTAQDQGKLFAAIARRQIARTTSEGFQNLAHAGQASVARRMTIVIVELFKLIDIQHNERYRGARAHGPAPFLLQKKIEVATVGDAAKIVRKGERLEALFHQNTFGDTLV